MATWHLHTSCGENGRVVLHESAFARSQTCAFRIAEAYESRIELQSAAPTGDTKTQLKNPSTAAITAKDGRAHLRCAVNKRRRSGAGRRARVSNARRFYFEIRASVAPALFPGPGQRDRLVRICRVVEDCYRARQRPFRLRGKLQRERAMCRRRKGRMAGRGLLFRERE